MNWREMLVMVPVAILGLIALWAFYVLTWAAFG